MGQKLKPNGGGGEKGNTKRTEKKATSETHGRWLDRGKSPTPVSNDPRPPPMNEGEGEIGLGLCPGWNFSLVIWFHAPFFLSDVDPVPTPGISHVLL
jgi:hypothetical protein